ncbi:MAG: endonuclease III domain-containing protein [Candidatus Geothermarchaeales archaeon]
MSPTAVGSREGKILEILRQVHLIRSKDFAVPRSARGGRTAFETLVVTLLSQNTNDRNTRRAYENLRSSVSIEPQEILKADVETIEDAIRVGGLYRTKTKALKALSSEVLERFRGDLDTVLNLPLDEAREILMSLPKIGPKTADVMLLFLRGRATVPVDTHVNRVSRRLGLAPPKSGYEAVRQSLMGLFRPEDYLDLHLLLIAHGRKVCQARKPRCPECPVAELCTYPNKTPQEEISS